MRITNRVLTKGFLGDLNNNLQNMRKYQEQLSSGKEIRRPSDNPFRVSRALELRTSISVNERYKINIEEGISWLETTDTALGQIGDVMQRARELTIAGGNGAYSASELNSIKTEMEQLREQIIQIGNTGFDGRYIFGGDKTNEKPFQDNGQYIGSTNGLIREFSPGVTIDVSTRGEHFSNVLNLMDNIITDLAANQSTAGRIAELDKEFDNVLKLRSEAGAKSNRLDAMKAKSDEEIFNMTQLLSKTEDIDVAAKIMEYSVMESIYTASLQAGARIIQPSLLDFLR